MATYSFYNNKSPREKLYKDVTQIGEAVTDNAAYSREYLRYTVVFDSHTIPDTANYALISGAGDTLGGYYFIDLREALPGGMVRVTFSKDVLSTLLGGNLVTGKGIVREHITGSPYVDNGTFSSEVREAIEKIDFPLYAFEEGGEYILITAGGLESV